MAMSGNKSIIRSAEILCVGTELLLGDIVNTNAAFLSSRLAALGVCVFRHTVVGDNPRRLTEALESAFENANLVITSGGLGPTYDDLTKETVAKYFGAELVLDERSLERIKNYFAATGRVMTENNVKQAMMPTGAHIFDNDYGTAPSLAISSADGSKTVIMLPGPPDELTRIFDEKVAPYIKERSEAAIVSKNVNIFGIGESALEEKIKSLMENAENPTVAPYCKAGEVRLRVTAKAETEARAEQMCDETVRAICESEAGEFVYGIDKDTLERALVDALHDASLTLSCAESLTGGLIAPRVTSVAGCSDVFFGGAVTYTNEMKRKMLGVSEATLKQYGAVSRETAMEMARGARQLFGTDIAVSATGVAGPATSEGKAVGTVYIGLSTHLGESYKKLELSSMRSREYIRTVSASNAINMALCAVEKLTEK